MRFADIVLGGALLAATGCAGHRTYSPGAAPGGSSGPSIPNITPDLGSPAQTPTGSGGASFYRGSGPTLKMPEASRGKGRAANPQASSGWRPTSPRVQNSRYRPAAPPATNLSLERTAPVAGLEWNKFYRSTDRRPIEMLRLGSGTQRIAVLGSIHGDETQSVGLVEELARYLNSHPSDLRNTTVLLVKTPNPDGLFARSPYNIRGVDLNRNFPAANWKSLHNSRGGSKSASEAETRAVMQALTEFKPTLLVHLKDSRDQAVVNGEGDVEGRGRQVADLVRGESVQGLGAKTTGSMESYATTKLGCPSLTLLLAVEADDRTAWSKNRDGLLAAIGMSPPAGSSSSQRDDDRHPFDRPAVTNSSLKKDPTAPAGALVNSTRSRLPDYPLSVPDHGYFELPPP
jgi:hypothetical protein